MAHKFEGPKDKTNPFMYVPVAAIAVGIVAWVFASGLLHGLIEGKKPAEVKIVRKEKPKPNIQALGNPTPELVAQGKSLYGLYCASCHGAEGLGDGEKGLSLNPKPRNYHSLDGWKNGASVKGMWKTLQEGIAGGSMASYVLTPEEERIAIIHYIRETWVPNAPPVTPDDIAALPAGSAADGSAAGGAVAGGGGPNPEDVAITLVSLQRPAPEVRAAEAPAHLADMAAADLYAAQCATCHGPGGGGMDSVRVLTSNPYMRVSTAPFAAQPRAKWLTDTDAFSKIIVESEAGRRVHGFGTLTADQVQDLQEYVAALAREGARK